jgi:hypothetical protein
VTTVILTVSVAGCANHPGPTITVDGAVEFTGLNAQIIVRDAEGSSAGQAVIGADIVALPAEAALAVPKQPTRGGVGGNPWIWAQLVDASSAAFSDEILIGRCLELDQPRMKALQSLAVREHPRGLERVTRTRSFESPLPNLAREPDGVRSNVCWRTCAVNLRRRAHVMIPPSVLAR